MKKLKPGQVPDHIREQWGTSRKFKTQKRALLKRVIREWQDFRMGCAYIPCGTRPVMEVDRLLAEIAVAIGEKNWGR
jgi:hypothetical protein